MSSLRYYRSPMCRALGCVILDNVGGDGWSCHRACNMRATNEEMQWWLVWCGYE